MNRDFSRIVNCCGKLCIAFCLLLVPRSLDAQYLRSSGSHYQPMTYEEMVRPILELQKAHNQAENAINELYSYVSDVLGHEIDGQLRQEMNSELKTLESIAKQLSQSGYSASINSSINASYRRIQQSIADYNNRVAKYKEQVEKEAAVRKAEAARKASEPEEWSGTGFALKNGYVVTNHHVVNRASSILVYGINGNMSSGYKAKVFATDKVNDIAILQITDSRYSGFGSIPYSVKSQLADVGEDIWVLGYPLTQLLGNEIKLTNGIISSRSGFQGDLATYQISAPVQPGNSGGPLFDSKGNVIGIVNAGVPGAENVGYAIKTSYLKLLLDNYDISSILPSNNTISSLTLKEQVKRVKDFVFYIHCEATHISNSTTPKSSFSPSSGSTSTESVTKSPTTTVLEVAKELSLPSSSGRISVYVSTTASDYNVSLLPSWAHLERKDRTSFTLSYSENPDSSPRSSRFNVSGGGRIVTVTITQSGNSYSKTASQSSQDSSEHNVSQSPKKHLSKLFPNKQWGISTFIDLGYPAKENISSLYSYGIGAELRLRKWSALSNFIIGANLMQVDYYNDELVVTEDYINDKGTHVVKQDKIGTCHITHLIIPLYYNLGLFNDRTGNFYLSAGVQTGIGLGRTYSSTASLAAMVRFGACSHHFDFNGYLIGYIVSPNTEGWGSPIIGARMSYYF